MGGRVSPLETSELGSWPNQCPHPVINESIVQILLRFYQLIWSL